MTCWHAKEFLEHHDFREELLFENQTNYGLQQQNPEPSQITEEPESQQMREEQEHSQIKEEPEPPQVSDEAELSQIRDEPEVQMIIEEPEPPQIIEEPDSLQIREEPDSLQIIEEPEPPQLIKEQEVGTIRAELLHLKEKHEEPGFAQTKEHNELCRGQNEVPPRPSAEEQRYPSERGGEADTERLLPGDSGVHCVKKYIDSESTTRAGLEETSVVPGDLVDEVLVSQKQVECEEVAGEETESHQNLETISNRKKMRCRVCGRGYRRKRFFLAHVKTHTGEKQSECEKRPSQETPCRNASETRKLYRRLGILNDKKLSCALCDRSYSKKPFLMAHMRVHKGEDWSGSEKPPRVETRRENAAKEQVANQTGEEKSRRKAKSPSQKKVISCEVCGRTYTRSETLLVHTRTHTGEKPYCCEVCGNKCGRRDGLASHMSHTGERPFSCGTCGKRFSAPCHSLLHKRIHTGEKPHACQVCRKSFSLNSHLIAHTRTHTGERPFPCEVCGRSFTVQSHLLDHVRTHTGEKPYVCELCARAFSIHGNLVRRMKTHRDRASFL